MSVKKYKPTTKVVKVKAPSQRDLQNRIEALQEDRDDYAAQVDQLENTVDEVRNEAVAYRNKYQKLRNRLERGLSLWDHVTILFGMSNIIDEIEIE